MLAAISAHSMVAQPAGWRRAWQRRGVYSDRPDTLDAAMDFALRERDGLGGSLLPSAPAAVAVEEAVEAKQENRLVYTRILSLR